MPKGKVIAGLCLSLAMALVGSGVVASKLIADGMHPLFAVPVRFAISTPIFLLLMFITHTTRPRLSRGELGIIGLQAAAGSAAYSILMIAALRLTSGGSAGVISGLLPILTALVATVVLREKLAARLWLAIVAVTSGALLVSLAPTEGGGSYWVQLLGNLLVVLAVTGEALFSILNKKITRPLPPLYVATLMSAISLALTLPLGLLTLAFQPLEATSAALAATAYVALFPTVLGFWLWYSGSSRMSGGEASVFMAVLPIAALPLSYAFLGERVEINHLIGIALVVFGIVYASLPARSDEIRPAQAPKPTLK